MTSIKNVASINLETVEENDRGNLAWMQSGKNVPFSIARIFCIYGTLRHCERGAHAHHRTEQAFIAISGSFSLEVSDGHASQTYLMNKPNRSLYVPPLIWVRLYDFSEGAVCLVLASTPYDSADYLRDWNEYVSVVAAQGSR